MSEDEPLEDHSAAAQEFYGVREMLPDEAATANIGPMSQYLDAAAERGKKIEEIPPGWINLEFETSEGRIVLAPSDLKGEGVIVAKVVASEDPAMPAGGEVTIDGMTSSGDSARYGVIGPGARLAFHRRVIQEYRVGDKDDHEALTLTQATIEQYTRGSQIYKKTEGGLVANFADPAPLGSAMVNHALAVYEQDGEPKSLHLF